MRQFLGPKRLWGREGGPDEDWVKPHVLWLPQSDPQVMAYFGRLREIVEQYPDVIAPIADEDLHMTVQKINQHTGNGTRVNDELLARAAVTVQRELNALEPFDIEIGRPARPDRPASSRSGPRRVRPRSTVPSVRACSRPDWISLQKRSTSGRICPVATASRTARPQPWRNPRTGLRPRSARASGPRSAPGPRWPACGWCGSARTFSATPTRSRPYAKCVWARPPEPVGVPGRAPAV